jgi:hypothetical protein
MAGTRVGIAIPVPTSVVVAGGLVGTGVIGRAIATVAALVASAVGVGRGRVAALSGPDANSARPANTKHPQIRTAIRTIFDGSGCEC